MNQTQRLAALARVAINPAINQPHLGHFATIAAADFTIDPGDIHIHLDTYSPRPLLNSLTAWAYLLDQPTVTLIDYGTPSGVHIHVDGYLAGDHIAAWSGVTGTAAAILRETLNGQKRTVVPLHVLRSTAVRLSDGAANLARIPTTDPGLRAAAEALA